MSIQKALMGLAALFMTLSLGACANEFDAVKSPGYFARNGVPFSNADVEYQDKVTAPICDVFVKETTPGRWVTIGAHTWNNGLGGAIASGGNLKVQSTVLNATLKAAALPADTLGGAVFYGVMGGINGNDTYNARKFGNTQVCLKSAAGGLQPVPPSLAEAIRNGTVSQYKLAYLLRIDKATGAVIFGMPSNWGSPIAPAVKVGN